ncbi:hypothetical protein [Aquitalea sp. ASV15]|uniref:hypothetical protein n=1 Tax=Aquitalea sp. ASV15 TaxID=2795104 RepID=UPI0018EBA1C8|nr:hypothetical protein [Aquitalea sp. ASV15]
MKYLSLASLCSTILLAACSSTAYTVDDGRKVNQQLLSNIKLYGQGERVLRPAIVRSATMNDQQCAKRWELPFSVASSYLVEDKTDRVAWVRGLNVDERLTVVGAAPASGLAIGDKLTQLDGYHTDDSEKMLKKLEALREDGSAFPVVTDKGKTITINPVQVCRGLIRLAPPTAPYSQSFHWEKIVYPLEIFNPALTEDEALWMVVWGQGVSEEGGTRMKSYAAARWVIDKTITVASLAMSGGAIYQAGKAASTQIMAQASSAAAQAATNEIAKQAATEAAKQAAEAAAKAYLEKTAAEISKKVATQTASTVAESYIAREGFAVDLMDRVAATSFDDADAWAYTRMSQLHADQMSGASLHYKLFSHNYIHNPFILDKSRLDSLNSFVKSKNGEAELKSVISGGQKDNIPLLVGDMPEANPVKTYEDTMLPAATTLPADATHALLEMPDAGK